MRGLGFVFFTQIEIYSMKRYYLFLFLVVFVSVTFAQKKPLTLADFDSWKSISNQQTTKSGNYITWQLEPQEGDGELVLYNTLNGTKKRFARGSNPRITSDEKYLVFTVKPLYAEEREAKRKKKKKDEIPKDHLVIYSLSTAKADTIKNIESYKLPAEEGNWVAITLKVEEEKKEAETQKSSEGSSKAPVRGGKDQEEEKKDKKKKPKLVEVTRLVELGGSGKLEFKKVDKTWFPDYAKSFYFLREKGDSLNPKGLYRVPFKTLKPLLVDSAFKGLTAVSFNKRGTMVTYMTTQDSAKADVRFFTMKLYTGETPKVILDKDSPGMPKGWMPSPYFNTVIDEDKKYILVGTMPIPPTYPKDTMALEEEQVKLDIWSWHDDDIQPYQKVNKKRMEEEDHLGRINLSDYTFLQLADEDLTATSWPRDTLGQWVAAYDDRANRREYSWLTPSHRDIYLINIADGKRIKVQNYQRNNLSLSPDEHYAYWYDREQRHWFAYVLATGKLVNLSASIPNPVWDEKNDVPDDPWPYGVVGWINDSAIVIKDRYDLWAVDPNNPDEPLNLTGGVGRENNLRFYYEYIFEGGRRIPQSNWLLTAFNEETKDESIYQLDPFSQKLTVLQGPQPVMYTYISKAEKADLITYRMENFKKFPDMYLTNTAFQSPKKITNANPQQANFNWGTVELYSWRGYNKVNLDGLLYKPENFDPAKKYPVLIYFYETYSDRIHDYKTPAPSASTINIAYFVSNGYIVFVPDIVYEIGQPGQSAYDCIVSGAEKLAKESWVDEARMAIQGQSWGGYQVAWLVTQTDLFKCAMAGAPVSNMTSAYGGIRWGAGMSRQFQYERTQSRLGVTLWDDIDRYLANSPVFYANQVNTPLLMMHNDEDGAVPWYQGIEYFMALRRLNKPVWLLVYNGEDHNLRKRHNRKDLSVRMAQFFDHYLKDAPAPEWMVNGRKAIEKDDNPATGLVEK